MMPIFFFKPITHIGNTLKNREMPLASISFYSDSV